MQTNKQQFFIKLSNQARYDGPEELLQKSVASYIRLQYPGAFFFHPPNEGRHRKQYRAKQKAMGLLAGLPDVMILNHGGAYHGLAIELKVMYNKPSEKQLLILAHLASLGYLAAWCNEFETAKKLIDIYFETYVYKKETREFYHSRAVN
jgi:hypothetical protein